MDHLQRFRATVVVLGVMAMLFAAGCGAQTDSDEGDAKSGDSGCATCTAAKTADGWCADCKAGYVDGKKTACQGCFTAMTSDEGAWCEGCGVGHAKGATTKCKNCFEAIKTDGSCEGCEVTFKDGKVVDG